MVNAGIKLEVSNEKQFKKELDDVNASLKLLDANSKLTASQFEASDKSTEALTAQYNLLNQAISTQTEKLGILTQGYAASAAAYGDTDKRTVKWNTDIAKTQTELLKLSKALDINVADMNKFQSETDQSKFSLSQFADAAKIGKTEIVGWLKTTASTTTGILTSQALSAAGQQVKDFVSLAISQASDLQEVQNVIDTTFESNSQSVYTFAENAAEAFGISKLAALQYTGTLGSITKSMGASIEQSEEWAKVLTGLAGDIASFRNADVESVFKAIRSGITGETEPLKNLGINLSVANLEAFALAQGMETAYSKMSQVDQVALRIEYLRDVTKDMQGDFAKTSDSFANQQRIAELQVQNLAATLGQELLPVLNEILTKINDELPEAAPKIKEIGEAFAGLVGFIAENTQEVTYFVGAIGTMTAALKISQTASAAATALNGVAGAATTAATASKVAAVAMNAIPLVAIATGATLAAAGITKLIVDLQNATPWIDEFNAKLEETANQKGVQSNVSQSNYSNYDEAYKHYETLLNDFKALADKESELRDTINKLGSGEYADDEGNLTMLPDDLKKRMEDEGIGVPQLLEELEAELADTNQAMLVANELQARVKEVVDTWEGAIPTMGPGRAIADLYAARGAEAARQSEIAFNQAIEAEKQNLEKLSSAWSELDHQYAMHTIATEEELYQKRQELLEEFGKPNDTDYYKFYEQMTAYADKQAEIAADALEESRKEAEKVKEDIKKQGEDIAKAVSDSIDEVDKTYEQKFNELESKKSAYAAKLSSFAGEIFAAKPDEDGNYIIGNIDKIIARMESFNEDMQKLKASGASEGMLNELMGLDPEAAAKYADYLANASAAEFNALNAQYQKAQALADQMASEFYASDYQNLELEKANAKIQAITDTLNAKLQESEANAEEAGTNAADAYVDAVIDELEKRSLDIPNVEIAVSLPKDFSISQIELPDISATIPDVSFVTEANYTLQNETQTQNQLLAAILSLLQQNQTLSANMEISVNTQLPGIDEIATTVTQIQNQRLQRIGG
jgi:hypothetical protein